MNNRFFWDDERIRFFRDAAEHTGFHRTLASLLAPELQASDRVLDAGCGLGYLSTALLPYCKTVTAIDCDRAAIEALTARPQGVAGIDVRLTDVHTIREPFDAIVCCYFGSTEESVNLFEQTRSGKLILIKRRQAGHRFSEGQPRHERTAADAEAYLQNRGYAFRMLDASVPFDQPFRSFDDAVRFFEHYRGGIGQPTCGDDVQNKLVETQDPEFPYRLPVTNEMRIFVIESKKQP
ncbi:MAG: class I SAM-dependent methyltransferase [Clostridia bacterium]|nr:class I SAM-dependent methyltransferase [Clostridia bacterium]